MFRISNNLIGCLNFLTLLFSIPIFVCGIWLATHGGSDCQKVMQGRAIVLGAFLMVISLAGFIGACFRVTWLMWFYLVLMFLVILLSICFIAFDFAVTAKGGNGGQAAAGRGFREYNLSDYSHWLRDWVQDKDNWKMTRSCLVDIKVCKSLQQESNETYTQFFKSQLSPIESGCCKPPLECGLVYQKPTVWTVPQGGLISSNPDCKTWKNDNATFCFDCSSCKAASVAVTKKYWRSSAIVNTVSVVFLIVVYAIGCCALRNNKEDNKLPKLKGFAEI